MKTDINKALLLRDEHFDDENNNIDFLNNTAMAQESLQEKHNLIVHATKIVEQFHSYFHFEQSFFHNLYAGYLVKQKQYDKATQEYKAAIFQDHLNKNAHIGLIDLLDGEDKEGTLKYAASFNLNLNERVAEYQRPYDNFSDYLTFATSSSRDYISSLSLAIPEVFGKYEEGDNLEQIIKDVAIRHKLYHKNAAIIYYNYYLILLELSEDDLAKNALRKSKNLDPQVTENIFA